MPSAEKTTSMAPAKVEVIQNSEQKSLEASQKDNDQNNGEKNTLSPIQQGLQIIQNKIRNLEKRKNKLDGYIKEEEEGKELSSDQKKAVANYDEVVNQLGISKEFCKQIQVIATMASKEAKREARKATFVRQMQETTKVREVIIVQDFLRQLKNEAIRNDFLQGSNGACLIQVEEMNVLEQFSKYTIPIHPSFSNEPSFLNSAKSAADHLSFLIDGRNRQFMETGFTYEKIKELFNRIQNCGYWEKDVKVVEAPAPSPSSIITQERPAESETPQSSDDLESKDDKMEEKMGMAPLPAQVPNPTQLFNGMIPPNHHGVPMHIQMTHPQQPSPQQQQHQQQQQQVGNAVQMQTTVTAVENAFFNQMKYSQQGPIIGNVQQQQQQQVPPQMNQQLKEPSNANVATAAPPNRIFEDFATANISFLQDSLVEQQMQNNQSQQIQQQHQHLPQKMQSNNYVSQPKPSPVQTQQPPLAANAPHQAISSFHHQQQSQTHQYPPGLKLQQQQQQQNAASNIPGTFPSQQQASQQAQQQQQPNNIIPPHLIQQSTQSYQAPPQQYQQKLPKNIQNLQDIEQKTTTTSTTIVHSQNPSRDERHHDLSNRTNASSAQQQLSSHDNKDKSRNNNTTNSNDWNAESNQQQPPQIDTWTNETSVGNNNQGGNGNYSRFNRGGRGTGQNSKFNNYRGGSQQPRQNYGNNENGGGVGGAGDSGSSTFFRNNEKYRGEGGSRGYVNERGYNKQRDSNYRAGSGRFLSGTVTSTNPNQRK